MLVGGEPGVVEGDGELRADVQVDHFKALFQEGREEINELLDAGGGGLGQTAVRTVAGVDILRGKLYPVQIALVPKQDGQGDDVDLVALSQLLREVTGAVCGDDNGLCHKIHSITDCVLGDAGNCS